MSKRFTATDKWQDKWFRKLEPKYKLLWQYILDSCDCAGIWELDLELAGFFTGCEYDLIETRLVLDGRIQEINGLKWFIQKFIDFQYGTLTESCKPHLSVIKQLEKHGLSKGYSKGIQTFEEKEKDKDKEKDKEKDKDKDRNFHFQIIECYHEILPELPMVGTIDGKWDWKGVRQQSLNARIKESKARLDIEWWRGFFEHVRKSDFLMGRKKEWRANLGWLLLPTNFEKVKENQI